MTDEEGRKKDKGILSNTLGGGPLGLGDPDDTSLRKVEIEICIPQIMKERAHKEKCVDLVKVFSECGKQNGLLLPFKCRKENSAMIECLTGWYANEEFKEECKKQYLLERAHYRRTGVPVRKYHRGRRAPDMDAKLSQ